MSTLNGQETFLPVYAEVTARNKGSFVPDEAAEGISAVIGVDVDEVRAALYHPPAEGSMYDDAARFLVRLAQEKNQYVSIWTQGELVTAKGGPGYQLKKIGQAGVAGMLNPGWRSHNRSVGLPRVMGDIENKSRVLPSILPAVREGGFERIAIVDDRLDNHVNARRTLHDEDWAATEHYLMDRSGLYDGSQHDFPFAVVESFDEVPIEPNADAKVLWLLDFDYTLIDHKKVIEQYTRRVDELTGATHDIRS